MAGVGLPRVPESFSANFQKYSMHVRLGTFPIWNLSLEVLGKLWELTGNRGDLKQLVPFLT